MFCAYLYLQTQKSATSADLLPQRTPRENIRAVISCVELAFKGVFCTCLNSSAMPC